MWLVGPLSSFLCALLSPSDAAEGTGCVLPGARELNAAAE